MKKDLIGYIGNGLAVLFSALQTEEVRSIISWVLTCIATIFTIAYTAWRWWKKAHEDGKITQEELDEGMGILKDGADVLSNLGKKSEDDKK